MNLLKSNFSEPSGISRLNSPLVALQGWVFSLLAMSIVMTPYVNDDIANQEVRGWSLRHLISFTASNSIAWADSQGRFFPSSLAWTYGLFWAARDRITYKLILVVVIGLMLILTWLLVQRLANSNLAAHVFTLIVIVFLQLRVRWDALVSFAVLIPWALALCIAAVLLISSATRWHWMIGSIIYFIALTTYETVLLFLPPLIAMCWHLKTGWRRLLFLVVPAFLQLLIVSTLRLRVDPSTIQPGYKVSIVPSEIVRTFTEQFVSAIPQAEWLFGFAQRQGLSAPPISLVIVLSALVGIPILLLVPQALMRIAAEIEWKPLLVIGGSGAWIGLIAAFAPAITARWQAELEWGVGYINTSFQYFGYALVIAASIFAVVKRSQGNKTAFKLSSVLGALIIAVIAVLTTTSNLWIAAQIA